MSENGSEDLHPHDEGQRSYVLVTGANSGLGFSICERLIDDFIATKPSYQSLTLIITTRDANKSSQTVARLQRNVNRKSAQLESPLSTRITIQPERVDLTSLKSVYVLASNLTSKIPQLDSIILNAGIGAVTGLNWPKASWEVLTNTVNGTTYPTYKITSIGDLTESQEAIDGTLEDEEKEVPLGQIFASNVLGHYILTHLLFPILSAAPEGGRIIFISSLEAYAHAFSLDDFQGLQTAKSYESSKRLADLLVLTSDLSSTSPFTTRFLAPPASNPLKGIQLHDNAPSSSSSSDRGIELADHTNSYPAMPSKPALYVAHPGICQTSFVPMPAILVFFASLAFYLARLLGSPWHTVSSYKGAVAPVWLALASRDEIDDLETEGGKGKWGSGCDWLGREKVVRTGVKGWGVGGRIGEGG
ncbi:uncharacterized protein KY384_004283 [Bacidia gigantensis]|uniref:uncharacterized protein n=1 Tax=Bacidia gigantensis TaxID=2732470 RepID=UPI001D0436D4|nr:uncharacterized protein KY384_004283 [Bacidia gigantensis]KAG8530926.1 hypothetical protein KY384_004283 [Bacidia gigantensis]